MMFKNASKRKKPHIHESVVTLNGYIPIQNNSRKRSTDVPSLTVGRKNHVCKKKKIFVFTKKFAQQTKD